MASAKVPTLKVKAVATEEERKLQEKYRQLREKKKKVRCGSRCCVARASWRKQALTEGIVLCAVGRGETGGWRSSRARSREDNRGARQRCTWIDRLAATHCALLLNSLLPSSSYTARARASSTSRARHSSNAASNRWHRLRFRANWRWQRCHRLAAPRLWCSTVQRRGPSAARASAKRRARPPCCDFKAEAGA